MTLPEHTLQKETVTSEEHPDYKGINATVDGGDHMFPWVLNLRESKDKLSSGLIWKYGRIIRESTIQTGKASEVSAPALLCDVRDGTTGTAGLQ
eukprot:CAMPEP_0185043842 /NCGR_PEP_ID=MMETSP1103-20130426/43129_1 /TAXON_ID=36769 /ORGANISM="Paraphysomonas bandaiensis, Strain Caron Lab Isolate" /LENGTH=93 /DNA_ID=CAMNT_0027584063 /DNA_START=479 /DNA_END=758 /DNA_ORIENTATION=-